MNERYYMKSTVPTVRSDTVFDIIDCQQVMTIAVINDL